MKDRWVKIRVPMDTGAAGHVMPETLFSNVKTEHTSTPKEFVAVDGERIRDVGEKTIRFKIHAAICRTEFKELVPSQGHNFRDDAWQ